MLATATADDGVAVCVLTGRGRAFSSGVDLSVDAGEVADSNVSLKLIAAKTQLRSVDGAGHELGFKGKSVRGALPGEVLAAFQKFFA